MKNQWIVTLACLALTVACSASQEVAEDLEPTGVFVEGPCPVPIPDGLVEAKSMQCGTVAVPEFHAQPAGKRLHLQVAVFPSVGDDPSPAPLFVATAGPGASAVAAHPGGVP